jgi:hypothetical protein
MGTPLLSQCIYVFNEAYPQEKIQEPIDITKSVVKNTIECSEEIQARRQAWSKLADELNIDETSVNVSSAGININ